MKVVALKRREAGNRLSILRARRRRKAWMLARAVLSCPSGSYREGNLYAAFFSFFFTRAHRSSSLICSSQTQVSFGIG